MNSPQLDHYSNSVHSFDLIDQPWILVRDGHGDVRELSLMEVFGQAHGLESLVGEVPTQVFALTRLLLAILHCATDGPRDLDHWTELWNSPKLPIGQIKEYLDQYRSRFDLLHPDTPFLQVADLHTAKGEMSDLSKLIADVPNGKPFFSTRMSPNLSIGFGEAARWVVHCHAFDPSGIKSGAVDDPRTRGGKGYPIGVGWSGWLGGVIVEGSSLRETLLLNLIAADFTGLASWRGADRPAWERPPTGPGPEPPDDVKSSTTDLEDRTPTGPLDLYTWQSRRIRLAWNGDQVTGVLICNGNKLMPQNQHRHEPHSAWRRSGPQEKKLHGVVYMPLLHDRQRPIWRHLESLLPGVNTSQESNAAVQLSPVVLSWLGYLGGEIVGLDHRVQLRSIGMSYGSQSSVIEDITDDTLPLRVLLLTLEAADLIEVIGKCATAADRVARALGSLAGTIAAAQGGDPASPKSRAIELASSVLDAEFRSWLDDMDSATEPTDAQASWHRHARRIVERLGRDVIERAPMAALTGRNVNGRLTTSEHAEDHFYQEVRSALPMAFSQTRHTAPPATAHGALQVIGQVIDGRIQKWQRDLLWGRPTAQAASLATLARLRRGGTKGPGTAPDIFASALVPQFADPHATDDLTNQETAAHIALTLYALHQQSRTKPMHRRGRGLGGALRQLYPEEPTSPPDPITRRFRMLLTADTLDELVHYLRGLVQLLRGAQPQAIPLDYGLLADELVLWQQLPDGPETVRRAWARDYYRPHKQAAATGQPQTGGPTTARRN